MSQTQKEPMFKVEDRVRVTNRCLPLHLHVGHLIAEDVGGRFLFECDSTTRKGWVSQEDVQGVPEGWTPQEPPQPSPAAKRLLMIGDTVVVAPRVYRSIASKNWKGVQGKIIARARSGKQWHVESLIDPMARGWFYADELQIDFGLSSLMLANDAPQPEPSLAANVPETPNSSSPVAKLVSCLSQGMQNDQDLAWTWHCNLVACSLDEDVDHETANRAAARFMSVAFGVDVTTFDEWNRFDWAKKQMQPEPSPSANVPESPDSSVDHSADANQTVKQIVALTEEDGDEALYVDGVLTACDSTIYACDIAEAAANATVTFSHRNVEQSVSVWPKKLSDVFSANVSDSPNNSIDHSADASKMVDDEYREPTEDDVLDGPIQCEVRNTLDEEWSTERLKYVDSTLKNFRFATGNPSPHDGAYLGRLKSWQFARIKKASIQPPQPDPTVKESLTVETPDPAKITIGYTVLNAYEAGAEPITEPIERKRVLYIAGPMRGIAFFNYPMFDRVAEILRKAGNEVISPADEDRKHDGFDPFTSPQYANPDACVFPKEMDFGKTVRRCLEAVLRCDEIVLLPGWEKSNGAVAELTLAMWLGKRVRHLRISEGGYFSWACYWMGLEGLACLLRDHHIPEVAAPVPVVVDEDDEDEDILDTAARITLGDRNASYGPPDQDFRRTAGMWSALFGAKLQDGVTFEPRDVAMAMILLKCSRESHQRKLDNWVDIAGYARCGSKCN